MRFTLPVVSPKEYMKIVSVLEEKQYQYQASILNDPRWTDVLKPELEIVKNLLYKIKQHNRVTGG